MTALSGVVLEKTCADCDGKGGRSNGYTGDFYPCNACDGTGFVLTEIGENVFAFIEHAMKRIRFRS